MGIKYGKTVDMQSPPRLAWPATNVSEVALNAPEDFLLLTATELPHGGNLAEMADVRRSQRQEDLRLELPRFFVGQPTLIAVADRAKVGPAQTVSGIAASSGIAEGIVRVVLDPVADDLDPGESWCAQPPNRGRVPLMSFGAVFRA